MISDPSSGWVWRKSARSTSTNNCVEVGACGGIAAVRDSKNPDGPALTGCDVQTMIDMLAGQSS